MEKRISLRPCGISYLMFIRSLDAKELENESLEAVSGVPAVRLFPSDEDGQAMRSLLTPRGEGAIMYTAQGEDKGAKVY